MFISAWVLGLSIIVFIVAVMKGVYLSVRVEKLERIIDSLEGMEDEDEEEETPTPKKHQSDYDDAAGGG